MQRVYDDYSIHKFTYAELEEKYGISSKRIRSQFDKLNLAELKNDFNEKEKINLVLDACHFKKEFCLLLFRSGKRNIHYNFKDSEKIIYYEQALKETSQRYEFASFTIDGKRGVVQLLENLFSEVPVQLCQFHQVKTVLKYTTRKPKTECGKELKNLVMSLKS